LVSSGIELLNTVQPFLHASIMYVKKVAVLCNNLMMPGFNYPVQN